MNNLMKPMKTQCQSLIKIGLNYFSSKQKPNIQKKLFTPGPLLTTQTVKLAMNFDYGSRDPSFLSIVKDVNNRLLQIANVSPQDYASIIVQGSGTYGIESALGTSIPVGKDKHKLLIVKNGAYGERMETIAKYYNLNFITIKFDDNQSVVPYHVIKQIQDDSAITHLAMVHSETTAGIINPIQDICPEIKKINPNLTIIIDTVSSFGAYEIDTKKWNIDYLVSTSNKNLQGVPGFAFIIASLDKLQQCKGNSRSLALDAYEQWKGLSANGQFRFTPPTHSMKAFSVALDEFFEAGGIIARNRRYSKNQRILSDEMEQMGFKLYVKKCDQSCIITTFLQPQHPNFNFEQFYNYLSEKNLIIYPGKLTKAESFRIGSIGELYKEDMLQLTAQIKGYLIENQIPIPLQ